MGIEGIEGDLIGNFFFLIYYTFFLFKVILTLFLYTY
jgi:hypothetical protein